MRLMEKDHSETTMIKNKVLPEALTAAHSVKEKMARNHIRKTFLKLHPLCVQGKKV